MSWASHRRLLIVGLLGVAVLIVLAAAAVFLVHQLKSDVSCTDGIQNQDEDGVDCGGACRYLCTASVLPPAVSFTRAVMSGDRTDVIAYVVNPNQSAAVRKAAYVIELYNSEQILVASKTGSLDLPPGVLMPVFATDLVPAGQVDQVFLTFTPATLKWYRAPAALTLPKVEEVRLTGVEEPRVTALIRNPSTESMKNISLIATVFDKEGIAIAASRTLLRSLAANESAPATFIWNEPFVSEAGRVEVRPVPELP